MKYFFKKRVLLSMVHHLAKMLSGGTVPGATRIKAVAASLQDAPFLVGIGLT